ncbi:cardiolipin synthase [Nitrosomonas sp. Nm84]|uniref:cardiolipin synthase n=1 Tax=Nitrosomonas sp. Nm84 TaxID=200124 RepID=UPI000D7682B8|nr:cardiolipin synthase [Nitrosomonas sp. Nm84]PXW91225.1 cardiolipin synthase [Nitrosomonas sp. Nm84]
MHVKIEVAKIAKFIAMMFCLMLFVSCKSIPIIAPDMAMRPSHIVQFNGAHGPLTTQQSKAILARLKKDSADTPIFDRHLVLESEIVGSPLVMGNKVELLVDGPKTYDSMYSAIENAKDHINMETFLIEDDEIGRRFAELLISKQRSGVQVNLIYDSFGSIYTPKEFFKPLKESGANVLEFNPINPLVVQKDWQINARDHRKLLIVDGQIAFVGGINISSVYSKGSFSRSKPTDDDPPWRDTHLRMIGPVVSEFQKLFMTTWGEQKGEPLASRNYFPELTKKGNEVVRAIGSSPEEPYSQIYVTLLSAINSAENQIFLTNAYFVPDPKLLTALKEAAQRGVDVRLLLPEKTDSNMVFYASRSYYDELLSANVKIYERQDALLHAKTALVDDVWSTIGSTNLDWRSFLNNQEINAIILGADFGTQMHALFEQDLESSKQVVLEEWRKRSIGVRIKERAARLWARWL